MAPRRSPRGLPLAAAAVLGATLAAAQLSPYPLEGIVLAARATAAGTTLARPTGLTNTDYLRVAHGVVKFFVPYQAANGSIIDPQAHEEIQYATPCFAYAAATLVDSGYDTSLLGPATAALTSALAQLSNGTCASGHNNFFTYPSTMAFFLLSRHVDAGTVALWTYYLNNLDPRHYVNLGMNWGLVAAGGEFARVVLGGFNASFGSATWWANELDSQIAAGGKFTATGNYEDHSGQWNLNPLPYDMFALKYLTVIDAQGYGAGNYTYSALLRAFVERAAWTHLLQQSPRGELMTGGRSSQHSWNEAASAVVFEVAAARHAAAGDASAACLFRRAARLSLLSLARWVNAPTASAPAAGELQIVKNWFPPSARYGYEEYSYESQYNLLPAAQLASAYAFANVADAASGPIAECTGLADVGGFVFALPELYAIVANAGGTYVTVETGADSNYDATGLLRVHVSDCATASPGAGCIDLYSPLGPSAASQMDFWGKRQAGGIAAAGPWWRAGGPTAPPTRLGNATLLDVAAAVLTPAWNNTPSSVAFTVDYALLAAGALVSEAYTVAAGGSVEVTASVTLAAAGDLDAWVAAVRATPGVQRGARHPVSGSELLSLPPGSARPALVASPASAAPALGGLGATFLALAFDGANTTSIAVDPATNAVTVSLPGAPGAGRQSFTLPPPPKGYTYTWTYNASAPVDTRNGPAVAVDVALVAAAAGAEGDVGAVPTSITWRLQAAGAA